MDRIENVTARPGETERPLRDEELEAVNGGAIRALGGPDTRPHAAGDHAWGSFGLCGQHTGGSF
jgi:hypothetical protein